MNKNRTLIAKDMLQMPLKTEGLSLPIVSLEAPDFQNYAQR